MSLLFGRFFVPATDRSGDRTTSAEQGSAVGYGLRGMYINRDFGANPSRIVSKWS